MSTFFGSEGVVGAVGATFPLALKALIALSNSSMAFSACLLVHSFFYKEQFISNKLGTGQIFRKSKQLTGYFLKK